MDLIGAEKSRAAVDGSAVHKTEIDQGAQRVAPFTCPSVRLSRACPTQKIDHFYFHVTLYIFSAQHQSQSHPRTQDQRASKTAKGFLFLRNINLLVSKLLPHRRVLFLELIRHAISKIFFPRNLSHFHN